MGRWRSKDRGRGTYEQVITDGFVLSVGQMKADPVRNPFGGTIALPIFQLLKVHDGKPFLFSDNGRVLLKPVSDGRVFGDILKDDDPEVYDAVSFVMVPYNVRSGELEGSEVEGVYSENTLDVLSDSFLGKDGARRDVSLVCFDGGIGLHEDEYARISIVPDSQVLRHFRYWGFGLGEMQVSKGSWLPAGEFDIGSHDMGKLVKTVEETLVDRFGMQFSP